MKTGARRHLLKLAPTITFMLLAGCSNAISTNSEIEQGPVGVGRGINELKGTPCACLEIPMIIPAAVQV